MSAEVTLNVRLPRELKEHGQQALERQGVSTSEAMRRLFKYLEIHQELPECLKEQDKEAEILRKRILLRQVAARAAERDLPSLPDDWDVKKLRHERILEKYGDLL